MRGHSTNPAAIEAEIAHLRSLALDALRRHWRVIFGRTPPADLSKDLLGRMIAYRLQERAFGGLDRESLRFLHGLALIVANEHRAGLEAAPWRAAVSRQSVQEPQAFSVKTAKGLLLQAISDHSPQEVLAQSCWRGSSEDHAPVAPKRVKRKRAQMSNLGLDRGRICRMPPHGYPLGTLVASPEASRATIR